MHTNHRWLRVAFIHAVVSLLLLMRADFAFSQDPLLEYVNRQDSVYSWESRGLGIVGTTEIAELQLRSQLWQGTVWKHRLFLLKPQRMSNDSKALLVISGSRWRPEYESPSEVFSIPEEALLFAAIAEHLNSIVIVLAQVPFQPLFMRTEDELIAYTFSEYLNTNDSDWPLLLPMVKSAVRAMDASVEAVREIWNTDIETFTVLGASKRGWTTWLVGALDPRVTAIAPLVIDALNMSDHFPHQLEMWGSISEKLDPYSALDLPRILSSSEGRELRSIVDPYEYRERLTLPKLIINTTNDEYFPIDSINLYWNELLGEKYAVYIPNQGHDSTSLGRVIASLNMIHRATSNQVVMPRLQWEFEITDSTIKICIDSFPLPQRAIAWWATSEDGDFRDSIWIPVTLMADQIVGTSTEYEHIRIADRNLAIYAELFFASEYGAYSLTTTPAVLGPPSATTSYRSAVNNGTACNSAD